MGRSWVEDSRPPQRSLGGLLANRYDARVRAIARLVSLGLLLLAGCTGAQSETPNATDVTTSRAPTTSTTIPPEPPAPPECLDLFGDIVFGPEAGDTHFATAFDACFAGFMFVQYIDSCEEQGYTPDACLALALDPNGGGYTGYTDDDIRLMYYYGRKRIEAGETYDDLYLKEWKDWQCKYGGQDVFCE